MLRTPHTPSKSSRFAPPPLPPRCPRWRRLRRRLHPQHLARRIDRAVNLLDLRCLRQAYAGTGSLAHHPKLLLKVVLYETQLGHHSPALWHRHARENNPVRWLACGATPARSRWYAFRDRLGPVLDELNRQMLAVALLLGLSTAGRAALDGSFVAANSSRHKLLKAETLQQRLQQLQQACARDKLGEPTAQRPGWMAASVAGRSRQLRRYQHAWQRCVERQQRQQRQRACDRNKAQPVRVNPSDADAVPGLDKEKVYRPLFNVQLLRDLDSQLILAYGVFAQVSDVGTLKPMLERTRKLLGHLPQAWLSDSTYATGPHLREAEEAKVTLYAPWQKQNPDKAAKKEPTWLPKESFVWLAGVQAYQCPQGKRLELAQVRTQQRSQEERVELREYRCAAEHCQGCPLAVWCTPNQEAGRTVSRSEHEERFERLQKRMQSEEARELYKKRSQTVELSFADAKSHRQLRRFSGRGLARASIQVALLVLAHNAILVVKAKEAPASTTQTSPR